VNGLLLAVALVALTPPVYELRSGAVSILAYEPDGRSRFTRVVGPFASRVGGDPWLSDADVDPACRAALVAAEDVRFYRHPGIDRIAIAAALRRNRAHHRIVWGASTITQQLVKNVFLDRDKSPLRKLREMLGALLLDRIMTKDHQLTWYLNVAEFGPRVYGLEQAAQRYFGRRPRDLSLSECVSLFAILPDPIRSHPSLRGRAAPCRIVARWEGTLRALSRSGALPSGQIARARDELFCDLRGACSDTESRASPSSARFERVGQTFSASSASFIRPSHSRSACGST